MRSARGRAAIGESPVFDALAAVCAAEQGETEAADRLFARLGPIEHITMAARYMRHLLRAGRPEQASAFADSWAGRDPDHFLVPYQSAAWRLTGDSRWQWLEGDTRLIGVYDLAGRLPPLDALAGRLSGTASVAAPPARTVAARRYPDRRHPAQPDRAGNPRAAPCGRRGGRGACRANCRRRSPATRP